MTIKYLDVSHKKAAGFIQAMVSRSSVYEFDLILLKQAARAYITESTSI